MEDKMELYTVNENSDLERENIKFIPVDKRFFSGYICEVCTNRYELCQCEKHMTDN